MVPWPGDKLPSAFSPGLDFRPLPLALVILPVGFALIAPA